MDTENKKTETPDDDWVVYLPDKELRAFERALYNMEKARREFHRLGEEMRGVK